MAISGWKSDEKPSAQVTLDWARRAQAQGATGLLLRHPDRSWVELALAHFDDIRVSGLTVGVNTERPDLAWPVDFFHFKSNEIPLEFLRAAKNFSAAKSCGISCHSSADLAQAAASGFDYALLSPIFRTSTHPDAPPLGLRQFRELTRDAGLPVIALGGVKSADEPALLAAGAAGWAAITAFR